MSSQTSPSGKPVRSPEVNHDSIPFSLIALAHKHFYQFYCHYDNGIDGNVINDVTSIITTDDPMMISDDSYHIIYDDTYYISICIYNLLTILYYMYMVRNYIYIY